MTGRLDRYLRTLHGHGYWISAWYPIHDGADFECRLTNGYTRAAAPWWGVHADPLEALAHAMRKAHLPTEEAPPEECPTCGALYGEMEHALEPCEGSTDGRLMVTKTEELEANP